MAYVVAFTNLADIWGAIGSVRMETTGHGFLVDSNGVLIAGHLFSEEAEPTPDDLEAAEALAEQMEQGYSGTATVSYQGTSHLVTYTPVEPTGTQYPQLDWTVGVVVPSGEAFAPTKTIAWALLGLTMVILLGAALASFLLSRSILRPVNELAQSVERIGSGDLTGEIVIRTRDQIGTLAAAFLRMRDYLRGTLGEAGYSSYRTSQLAEEQSAATKGLFNSTQEIVDSVVVLAKNMEAQAKKTRKIADYAERLPVDTKSSPEYKEARKLLEEGEILADVGTNKAVEIASAAQDLRAATRDVAAAAHRLQEMAEELAEMVKRFKV
jgi:methyl-accepting chemotaxis protein